MATKATIGYTLEEMMKFGFFDLTEIKREAYTSEYGCEYYEECPCCNCDEAIVAKITYAGVRWSKSQKRMVEDIHYSYVCVAHAE
jgi:hypothetical protein